MTNSQTDSGLSLTDAAAQLGISERTVLRRIKDGTIDGRKIGEGRGGVWRVYLSLSDSLPASVSERPTDAPGMLSDSQTNTLGTVSDNVLDSPTQPAPEMLRMIELVDKLQTQNQQLAGQLGYLQSEIQQRDRQIALLMAPKDEPKQPAEPERRPWWRRLWGG